MQSYLSLIHISRKQVGKRARIEHYPAPYAIIDIWEKHHGNALAAPQLIDSIVRSPTARNLVRVFFCLLYTSRCV